MALMEMPFGGEGSETGGVDGREANADDSESRPYRRCRAKQKATAATLAGGDAGAPGGLLPRIQKRLCFVKTR